jgi:hypothetical protein
MAAKGRSIASQVATEEHGVVAPEVPGSAVERLQQAAGNRAVSQALDPGLRAEMEDRLGGDLSQVRIHTDAVRAGELGAAAVTAGSDVYFAPGVYEPDTRPGRAVIAHELAHVLQQTRHSGPSGVDAEAAASAAALGGGPVVGTAPLGAAQMVTPEEEEDLRLAAEESGRAGRGAFADDPDFYPELYELGPGQEDEDFRSLQHELGEEPYGVGIPGSTNPPGGQEAPNKAAGRFMHTWAQRIRQELVTANSARRAELMRRLNLTWPANVVPNEGPNKLVLELPEGKTYIPDGIDVQSGTVYELKPEGSRAAGRRQARTYAFHMDREVPRGARLTWSTEVVTYNMDAAIDWLIEIGELPRDAREQLARMRAGGGGRSGGGRSGGGRSGGGRSGGTGQRPGEPAKVAAKPPVKRSPAEEPAPAAPKPPVRPRPVAKPAPSAPAAQEPSGRTVPVRTVEGGVGPKAPPTTEPPAATKPASTQPARAKPVPPPAQPSLQEFRQNRLNELAGRTGAVNTATAAVFQNFHEQNMGRKQAEEVGNAYAELARLQPEIDRLTAQGYWVVKVVTFDVPEVPDFFGEAAGWTEEKDIKRFVGAHLRYGKTREDAYEDRGRPEGPQLYAADPSIAYRAAPQLPRVEAGRRWEDAVLGVVPPERAGPEYQVTHPDEEISGLWKTTGEPQESSLSILVTGKQLQVSMRWADHEYGVAGVRWSPDEGVLQVRFTSEKLPGWVRDSTFQLVGPGLIRETYVSGYPAARGQGVTDSGQRVWGEPTHFRASMEKVRR